MVESDKIPISIEGRTAGLRLRPAADPASYTLPAYADTTAFTEKEVKVGSGDWPLPGTLTLPRRTGRAPAVVLVHGSGPNDRDETVGPNKPFRDLAVGLASRGIAVLRYDKRTKIYASKMAVLRKATVREEVIDDAVAAVDLLAAEALVDPRRIFMLGHSLGGMLIPRIGQEDTRLAGLIVMAGAVRPLEQSLLDQTRYLAEAGGTVTEEERAAIHEARTISEQVRALKPSDAESGRFIFGVSACYWLDLRGYDPPTAARALTQPLLVLQGERDYQVTMDDFGMWKKALEGEPNLTFRSYPALNHLFIPGKGKSLPAEYEIAGHVSDEVIRDIAQWIDSNK